MTPTTADKDRTQDKGVLHSEICAIMGLVETGAIHVFAQTFLKLYTINPKSAPRDPGLDN